MIRRRCTKCGVNRQEKAYTSPRGRVCATCRLAAQRAATRRRHIEVKYGITIEEYDALLAAQNGVCAICFGARPYSLAVDHDHAVEKALLAAGVDAATAARRSVRGLCCKRCNRRVLGGACDNPAVLRRAADYLESWPSVGLLDGEAPERCGRQWTREYEKRKPTCHPDRPHEARGLCHSCYQRRGRTKK